MARSLIGRFAQTFYEGIWGTLEDQVFEIAVVLAGTLFFLARNKFSWQKIQDNLREGLTIAVWVFCALIIWHGIRAVIAVSRDIRVEESRPDPPPHYLPILSSTGEPLPASQQIRSNYAYPLLKLAGILAGLISLAILISALVWEWSRTSTNIPEAVITVSSDPFRISDRSFSFLNMNQTLKGSGSSLWWITYKSYLGDTASPVALAQYVEITNLLPTDETIKNYSVAVKTADCGWVYLSPINIHAASVWYVASGLNKAIRIDFSGNGLNYIFDSASPRVIQSQDFGFLIPK